MYDLTDTLEAAWTKVKPLLDANPRLLQQRLARRASARLQRPLREWSIALRSNDTRLNNQTTIITPHVAPAHRLPHTLIITTNLLGTLYRPFRPHWRDKLPEFASRVGVKPHRILEAVRRGQAHLERIKGLAGKRSRWGGIPLLHPTDDKAPFNPGGAKLAAPPSIWDHFWEMLVDLLPDHFEQTLTRVPCFGREGTPHPNISPEDRDTAADPRALANNLSPDDLPRFWGWHWRCPACDQTARLLFLPIKPLVHILFQDYLAPHIQHEPEELHSSFACAKCHRLRGQVSWASTDAWNHIISTITGGLLFGREVQIPTWLKRERKLPPRRSPTHRPCPRRLEVAQRLIEGGTYPQIGKDLGMDPRTVAAHVRLLRKQHKVKTRKQLIALLKSQSARPRTKTG